MFLLGIINAAVVGVGYWLYEWLVETFIKANLFEDYLLPGAFLIAFIVAWINYNRDPQNEHHKVDCSVMMTFASAWLVSLMGVFTILYWLCEPLEPMTPKQLYVLLIPAQLVTFGLGYCIACGMLSFEAEIFGTSYGGIRMDYCQQSLNYVAGVYTILSVAVVVLELGDDLNVFAQYIGGATCFVDVALSIGLYPLRLLASHWQEQAAAKAEDTLNSGDEGSEV